MKSYNNIKYCLLEWIDEEKRWRFHGSPSDIMEYWPHNVATDHTAQAYRGTFWLCWKITFFTCHVAYILYTNFIVIVEYVSSIALIDIF